MYEIIALLLDSKINAFFSPIHDLRTTPVEPYDMVHMTIHGPYLSILTTPPSQNWFIFAEFKESILQYFQYLYHLYRKGQIDPVFD